MNFRDSTPSRAPRLVPLLCLGAFAGSLLASCATVATHEEYGRYRAVRMAGTDRDKLIAMQQYIEAHPEGYWAEEVRGARNAREEAVWGDSSTTREGLQWYLRIYPEGTYVAQAEQRLAALEQVESTEEQQEARQRELEAQRRAEAAEARRTWVTRAVQFWTRNLLTLRNFGSPLGRIARSNEQFNQAFGNEPAPQCSPEACIKHYGQTYHIPVPGATRIDRHIDVYLRLVLDRGRMRRAEILLPNKGFSRWYEMENETVVTDEDPQQRMTAINWALDRIQPLIEEVAPNAEQFDYIPESIPSLPAEARGETSEAEPAAPDEGAGNEDAAAPAQADAPNPAEFSAPAAGGGADDNSLDSLLAAAGATVEAEAPAPQPQPEAQPAINIVLPIGLMSFRARGRRVVVFGAGEEDYGDAFDGIIIEQD